MTPRCPLLEEELKGMSEDYLKAQPQVAGLYMIGMDYPSFLPVQDYCEVEATRKKTWVAYKRRGGKKNVELLEKILKLRAQAANMLGYKNAAEYETEIRMAKNPQNVMDFYKKLRPLARKKAEARLRGVRGSQTPAHRRQRREALSLGFFLLRKTPDEGKIRRRCQEDLGVFSDGPRDRRAVRDHAVALRFEVPRRHRRSRGARPQLWHPDVRLFEVTDKNTGEVLGEFYLDLYPRPNKYGHAAQWGLYPRKVWPDGDVQKPLAALVCNFTKPTEDKPSLLTHNEVETFFHEFGHCLHSILTEAKYGEFSGTNVARDFVEAPSQMFENWVWDARVLNLFAQHYKTGEKFPEELLEGMLKARHLGSGMKTERQIYYGMVDMTYHMKSDGVVDTTKSLWNSPIKSKCTTPCPAPIFKPPSVI